MRPPTPSATPRLACALAAALITFACGKRGDPLPPLPRTPQAVAGFTVAQRADVLEVAMVAPRLTTGGERLGVVELELLRVDGPAGELDKGTKQRFRAAPGERVVETFPLPAAGSTVKLAARAIHGGERSMMGKMVVLTVQPPPPPPPTLTAQLRPTGVLLTWTMPVLPSPPPAPAAPPSPGASPAPAASPAVAAAATPAPVPTPAVSPTPAASATPAASPTPGASLRPSPSPPAGAPGPAASPAPTPPPPPPPPRVRLYRRPAGGELAPLVPDPLAGTSFEDTGAPAGQTSCYVARLVTAADPMVESAGSPEACVEVKDVFPPAVPTGLTALLQEAEVEVSWSPSTDADLKAYRLYRASGGAAPQQVTEVPAGTTTVRDTPAAGGLHVYTLTAVDQQGNESAHSAPAEVRRP